MRFPRNLYEWTRTFKDDLGFEPSKSGEPTDAPPGSQEKIAILRERVERGYRLWLSKDYKRVDCVSEEAMASRVPESDGVGFEYAGNERYGAVVGQDRSGHKHRYAIWAELGKGESPKGKRLLYITATASYVDSIDKDPELAAIKRHAELLGAEFIAVVPLFSARIQTERDLVDLPEPITEVGFAWIRWMAQHTGRVIVCWGETPALARHIDVLWLLSRTPECKVYSLDEEKWPPLINRFSAPTIYRYDYRKFHEDIAERETLEQDGDDAHVGNEY